MVGLLFFAIVVEDSLIKCGRNDDSMCDGEESGMGLVVVCHYE
jgi:hypothetical protein